MTNLSSDPHGTPGRGLGWAPAAPTAAPAAAGSTVPQEANPFAVRHTAETIAWLQLMQRLRDDARTRDEHRAQHDRDPGACDNTDEMVYLRIHCAETTRYHADVYVSPDATDAELYAEIANVPEAMRRTRDVADTDNTITSIIDLDDDGHPSVLERAISAGNTVSGEVDWGDLADTIDTRLAEGPDWPALSGALDRAAAAGYDLAANLPRLAAQDPLPAATPARNCNTGSSRTPTRPSHQASVISTPARPPPPAAPSQRSATTQGDANRRTPHPAGDATPEHRGVPAAMTCTRSIDLHRHRLAAALKTASRASGEAGRDEPRQHETPPQARPRDLEAVSIAIDTALVIKAEAREPARSYATRLMTFTDTGDLTDLAGHHVETAGPLAALRRLVDEERHADGLTPGEARDFHDQITRLTRDTLDIGKGHVAAPALGLAPYNTRLETQLAERLGVRPSKVTDRLPPPMAGESPELRWHDTVTAAAGPAVVADARWPALAAGLDRAATTGWDWATHLPQSARTPPLPDRQPADELYYRLLNAHPAAAPTRPADGNASPEGSRPPGAASTRASGAPPHPRQRPAQPRPLNTRKARTMTGETRTTIIGNLTADPDIKHTPSGDAVTSFTIAATPRRYDKSTGEWVDSETLFIRCSTWRRVAEHAAESLQRGMRVIAHGSLQQRRFESGDGEKRTVIELAVDEVGPSLRYATTKVTRTVHSSQADGDDQHVSASR